MPSSRPTRRPKPPRPGKREVHLNPEAMAAVERQKELFIEKFGREPGPNDPIFFDPNADEPTPINPRDVEDSVVDAAERAGIDPVRAMKALNMRDCEIEAALARAARRRLR